MMKQFTTIIKIASHPIELSVWAEDEVDAIRQGDQLAARMSGQLDHRGALCRLGLSGNWPVRKSDTTKTRQ